MPFKYDSGREFDTQNAFAALNTSIRENANRLCRGNTPNANLRRKDMVKILVEAAKTLKADQAEYDKVNDLATKETDKVVKVDKAEVKAA
jgi:fructose-1,6-bisphosphatase